MTITMLVALTILFLIFLQRPIFAGFIECSDDYFADYQVYGPCIAQKCGRFVAQLPEGIVVYYVNIPVMDFQVRGYKIRKIFA